MILEPTFVGRRSFWAGGVLKSIVHTAAEVELMKSRLIPPWWNTFVIVTDGTRVGTACLGIPRGSRLRDELRSHGFTILETKSWLSWGGDRIR